MSAESALLAALATRLASPGLLAPAPVRIGPVAPVAADELPALVLSLPELRRLGAGLGERASLMTGALAVAARIDLATPFLPTEPGFNLLSPDGLTLVLPHGGWVRADGVDGLLGPADLQVSVAGVAQSVVNGDPQAGQVRPNAATGTLRFGSALPPAGRVDARYFLGQWERRMTPIAGRLQISVLSAAAADVQSLSDGILDALDAQGGNGSGSGASAIPPGLKKLALQSLSTIHPPATGGLAARSRELHYGFEYEHVVDRPDSSGGVIRRIPVTARLQSTQVDAASGAIQITLSSEQTEVP